MLLGIDAERKSLEEGIAGAYRQMHFSPVLDTSPSRLKATRYG